VQAESRYRFRLVVTAGLLAAIIAGGLYGYHVWLPRRIGPSRGNESPAAPASSGRPFVLNPTQEAMANNTGVSYAARGEYDKAIAHFQMAVSHKDDYLPGWKNLLAALVETERWPEALEAAEKAEDLHPLRVELGSERPPAPSASSGQGPSTEPGEVPDARSQLIQDKDFLANLARAYLENGRLDKARSRFTLYLRLFPHELWGYNGLAEVAFREGDYERAVQLFAQSLKLYGDQPEVAGRLTEISEAALARSTDSGQALAERVQWVLASYLQPREGRPAMPEADPFDRLRAGPFAPTPPPPRHPLPIPSPEPVVELPKAPVPDLD